MVMLAGCSTFYIQVRKSEFVVYADPQVYLTVFWSTHKYGIRKGEDKKLRELSDTTAVTFNRADYSTSFKEELEFRAIKYYMSTNLSCLGGCQTSLGIEVCGKQG